MNTTRLTDSRMLVLSIVLSGGIFAVDLSLPPGVAGGAPYMIVVLASLWSPRRRDTYLAASTGTVLTALGCFFSPTGGIFWMMLVNRFLGLFMIWVAALLVLQRKSAEKALCVSEERYQNLFHQAPISLWEEDFSALPQWFAELRETGVNDLREYLRHHPEAVQEAARLVHVVDVNEGTRRLFGVASMAELFSTPRNDVEEHRGSAFSNQAFAEQLIAIWEGRRRFETKFVASTSEGARVDCLLQWVPPRAPAKLDLSHIIIAISDITQRAQAEGALRESERRLRSVLDGLFEAPIGLCFLDRELRYVFINEWLAKINGTSVEGHLGRTLREVVPEVATGAELQLRHVLETGEPVLEGTVEAETPAGPGRKRVFQHNYYPVVAADGAVVGVSCAVQDVTKRKRAEEALRLSERRYRELIDTLPHCIEECDLNGTITFSSPGNDRLKGYDLGEVVGQRIWDCSVSAEAARALQDWVRQLVSERPAPTPRIGQIKLRDGRVLDVRVDWNYTHADDGRLTGCVSVITDITARRRAEAQVHQHQEELAHMSRLNTMGEMATGLAHELNQPLASIVNYTSGCVQRIQAGQFDLEEFVTVLKNAASEARRAGEIIKRTRCFVQKREPARTTIDIPELIRQVLDLMHYELQHQGVQTRLEVEEHMPTLEGDQIQLQQVLLNLLRNGIEAMNGTATKHRRLIVGATTDNGDSVTLFVRDTGCGLGEADPDKIFETFYTTKEDGTGMGLAISRTIIEAHGGRLWATDNADGGCTFHFSLPGHSEA